MIAAFIRVVGSEFVQKYLGEGPRMVRDVFRLAKENSPAIIFIDEIDAIATKRFDAQTGADREVQRILLELLNQMDGFDQTTNVKVGQLIHMYGLPHKNIICQCTGFDINLFKLVIFVNCFVTCRLQYIYKLFNHCYYKMCIKFISGHIVSPSN